MSSLRLEAATDAADPRIGNEDAVALGAGLAVVADGVTPIDRDKAPCRHGVAWFASGLARELADRLTGPEGPTECLAAAIGHVRDRHFTTCDLDDVDAPAATIAAFRVRDDRLDYLVLADASVVLEFDDEVEVITDDRPARAVRRFRAETGRPAGARAVRTALANRPGGYWVAKADPAVSHEALTGSVPLSGLRHVIAVSDGAARLIEQFEAYDWSAAISRIVGEGPWAWIERTRTVERSPAGSSEPAGKRHDDATVALLSRF